MKSPPANPVFSAFLSGTSNSQEKQEKQVWQNTKTSTQVPIKTRPVTVDEYVEAKRIAGELQKAFKAGAIAGVEDPAVRTLALALKMFGGTLLVEDASRPGDVPDP